VERWWGGLPEAWEAPARTARRPKRQHTTIGRKVTEQDLQEVSGWVRAALAAGQVRFHEGDQTYPKHIWYRDALGQFWHVETSPINHVRRAYRQAAGRAFAAEFLAPIDEIRSMRQSQRDAYSIADDLGVPTAVIERQIENQDRIAEACR
jgi:hypothetical protein